MLMMVCLDALPTAGAHLAGVRVSSSLVPGAGHIGQAVVLQHALRVPQQAHVHARAQIHAGDDQVYENVVGRGIALGYGARLQHSKMAHLRQDERSVWRGSWSLAAAPEGHLWVAGQPGVMPRLGHEARVQHGGDMICRGWALAC